MQNLRPYKLAALGGCLVYLMDEPCLMKGAMQELPGGVGLRNPCKKLLVLILQRPKKPLASKYDTLKALVGLVHNTTWWGAYLKTIRRDLMKMRILHVPCVLYIAHTYCVVPYIHSDPVHCT